MSSFEVTFPEITAQHRTRAPWMKAAYKNLSTRIHALKGLRKRPRPSPNGYLATDIWTGYVEGLDELRTQARVLNIARGLLRGLKLEQIEVKPRLATASHGERVQYAVLVKQAIRLITDNFPIYVAVNTSVTMTPEQQAVQAGHALAVMVQGVKNLPWNADNGVLKYLDGAMLFGPSSPQFVANMEKHALENPASTWAYFVEPDFDDRVTAAAIYAPFGLPWSLRHMPALKLSTEINMHMDTRMEQAVSDALSMRPAFR